MQAILIATGENHKLLPLTGTMPTPMVPVVDRPAMVYAIELLARAGIRDIFVSLYDQADTIKSYFGNGERWNVNLYYLLQPNACGSAGAIKGVEHLFTESFLVLPADALVDLHEDQRREDGGDDEIGCLQEIGERVSEREYAFI